MYESKKVNVSPPKGALAEASPELPRSMHLEKRCFWVPDFLPACKKKKKNRTFLVVPAFTGGT